MQGNLVGLLDMIIIKDLDDICVLDAKQFLSLVIFKKEQKTWFAGLDYLAHSIKIS